MDPLLMGDKLWNTCSQQFYGYSNGDEIMSIK